MWRIEAAWLFQFHVWIGTEASRPRMSRPFTKAKFSLEARSLSELHALAPVFRITPASAVNEILLRNTTPPEARTWNWFVVVIGIRSQFESPQTNVPFPAARAPQPAARRSLPVADVGL